MILRRKVKDIKRKRASARQTFADSPLIRVRKDTHAFLQEESAELGMPMSDFITFIVHLYKRNRATFAEMSNGTIGERPSLFDIKDTA